jgi:hypothetical protein
VSVKQQGIKQTKVVLVGEIPDNVAVGAVVAEDSPYTLPQSRSA